MRKIKGIFQIFLYFLLFPIGMIVFKHKHPWLISERGDDARDNGYWMFVFLQEKKKNINSYFVIDKQSKDFLRLSKYEPNVVQKGSLKHWLIFIAADVRMSTHLFLFAPAPYLGEFIKHHHTRKTVNVDLQHGITHNSFPSNYKNVNGSDLYICGAKPEYVWIKNNFGWDDKSIQYTGFARFDGLHGAIAKKQLLIMPTWRSELKTISKEEFLNSQYFKSWESLLNDNDFKILLKENDFICIFYIHYSLQHFSNLFKSDYTRITIATFDEYEVQSLLKDSSILITDYSSVFFDFAYMRKPLLYYQFDYDYFYSHHYKKGFFDHKKDGFGDVCLDQNKLLDSLKKIFINKCQLDKTYENRINKFFELNDANNCERIYNAVETRRKENGL